MSHKLEQICGNSYITADLDPAKAERTLDITAIDYESNTFDVILCFHVLEHIPDDQKALRELYRVLKPNGIAFFMVPLRGDKTDEDLSVTDESERRKRFLQSDHVRLYGMDIKDRMEKQEFTVSIIKPQDVIENRYLRNFFGIIPPVHYDDDYLFVGTKRSIVK